MMLRTVRELDLAGAHLAFMARQDIGSADPLTLLGALATTTTNIGLVASMSPWQQPPFLASRAFATADAMTRGRVAWRFETDMADQAMSDDTGRWTSFRAADDELAPAAADYLQATLKLWDSWEPDAIIADVTSGRYVDASKVHVVDHRGQYFSTRGPLNLPRSPQGRPVIVGGGSAWLGNSVLSHLDVMVVDDRQEADAVRDLWDNAGRRDGIVLSTLRLWEATVPGILARLEETASDGVLIEEFRSGADAGILLNETIPSLTTQPPRGPLHARLGLAPERFDLGFAKAGEVAL